MSRQRSRVARVIRVVPVAAALVLPVTAAALAPTGPAQARSCKGTISSDFNGDGFADLAAGEPGAAGSRGAVHVLYGTAAGLTAAGTDTAPANQYFGQDTLHRSGAAIAGEVFGHALATGDFNGDGCDDLAVGSPYDAAGNGMVSIVYGSPGGLVLDEGTQRIIQGSAGVAGTAEGDDLLGWSVAAGDMNGDDFDDLAIGAPGEVGSDKSGFDHGAVVVVPGGRAGLRRSASTLLSQDSPDVPNKAENGDRFGTSVAFGDINRDGLNDLAIGVPGEDRSAGAVIVLAGNAGPSVSGSSGSGSSGSSSGSPLAISGAGSQLWSQRSDPGFGSPPQPGDLFGQALAAGDFDGDGADDLAIGVPGERRSSGVVNIGGGGAASLAPAKASMLHQSTAGVADQPEPLDEFGASLAAGDFNGDRRADLAIGVPGEGFPTVAGSGGVAVAYGGVSGVSGAGSQWWTQDAAGVPETAESFDRFGSTVVALRVRGGRSDDLIIGAPSETIGGQKLPLTGVVQVLRATNGRLISDGNQLWETGTKDIGVPRYPGGNFGYSVA